MKKVVTFLLISVYTFAMAGTTVAMHYCMGEKIGTTLGYDEQNVCEFCHMEKHLGEDRNLCCKDENQFVKVDIDQDMYAFINIPQVPVILLSAFFLILISHIYRMT